MNDYPIMQLAENILDHKHILTDEVIQLNLMYNYLNEYVEETRGFVDFYKEVKEYAFNLKYGDLEFFSELLENNYKTFKEITDKMLQRESIMQSIDEMEKNANDLLAFIEKAFANTHIKADFLDSAWCFIYYVDRIKVHRDAIIKLQK